MKKGVNESEFVAENTASKNPKYDREKPKMNKTLPVLDPHFHQETVTIGLRQRLSLKILEHAVLFRRMKPGWRNPLPFYVVKCGRHGYYIDYPQGYKGYFRCPKCDEESERKRLEKNGFHKQETT